MLSSHSRPLLGGDKEPDMIFYNGDNINKNNGIKKIENLSKTDGGMIQITNAVNKDKNNSTSTTTSSIRRKKGMDKSTTTRRRYRKQKIKIKIKNKMNLIEMLPEKEEEKEIHRVVFDIEKMKLYDGEKNN